MNVLLCIFVWLLVLLVVVLLVVVVVNGWVGVECWLLVKLCVYGEFKWVLVEQLQQVLLLYVCVGFFVVKLQDVQDVLEKLLWVESVQVCKQWLDVLEVILVEYKLFVCWGNDCLVFEQGKLFFMLKKLFDLELLELDGLDSQIQEVMKLYSDLCVLFVLVGVDVCWVMMDVCGSWLLVLSNGIEVVVGCDDVCLCMQCFVKVLLQFNCQDVLIECVDFCYINGFMLSWGILVMLVKMLVILVRSMQERI